MSTVTYRTPEALDWFRVGAREARSRARAKGSDLMRGTAKDLAAGIKQAASTAADYGKGAFSDLVHRQAGETAFMLLDDSFEAAWLSGRKRIAYKDVSAVVSLGSDRFEVRHKDGSLTIRPVAHLTAGRLKVAVGWSRNGLEVPFETLPLEIAARCGLDVASE
jgi:hypothetical protein